MIQYYLMQKLQSALPGLEWTVDNKSGDDNTGAVYLEGGSRPGAYDVPIREPRYMVYISSSDWSYAEYAAMQAVEILHQLPGEIIPVEYEHKGVVIDTKLFALKSLLAAGDINPVGIDNGVKDFSINFDAYLIELKEENTNGIRT